ncbi:MAG: translation elongation factor Ts [Puniceicoccales bacterium]|jgi:elongation factor Ts|nr:translation elongation factor Ts [Puniceicoccales bacterium]
MVEISAKMVNDLRQRTGGGLMECKKALLESNGDEENAIAILKKKGIAGAAKKAGRDASEGIIQSYIHGGGKIGVLLELNCETDFVAKNEAFHQLARDICMHIAAMSPIYVSSDEILPELEEKERAIAIEQCAGKPPSAVEKIVAGKMAKWYSEVCLLDQPFVKEQDHTVGNHIAQAVARIGENIKVGRFVRYKIGER